MDADRAGPEIWPAAGSLLGDGDHPSYRLGRLIHQAESALIYAASNEFGRPLVLKVYRPQPMQGEAPAVQWQRERQIAEPGEPSSGAAAARCLQLRRSALSRP